ncbi:glycosyltransferase [Sphingomonas sp. ID0503]|uniref:glycosyltransferase family 4 protein n=1 Tax=Sphingomonas sp. ID0503 TaxID=3399691 RepID=UPI003AFA5060
MTAGFGRGPAKPVRRIALIGNFLPRRCGIATYTTDIYNALRDRYPETQVDVFAMNDAGKGYEYPAAVTCQIEQQDVASYLTAARKIEAGSYDAVWLQHEYGIFGGSAGDHVLKLLDRITTPVAVTLHTILTKPNPDERRVMDAIIARAAKLLVMAERGREILIEAYGASPQQIAVIPHGIPDRPLAEPESMKAAFDLGTRPTIMTFGLLSPGKGVENVIAAMPRIVARFPDVVYVIVGATHPHLVAHEGEKYRDSLQMLATSLGVGGNIRWVNAFLDNDELLDYLTAADIYITPYLNPAQVTSGTLSYAVGLGKPVVSTPYVHARELLAGNHGVLVDFGNSDQIADAVIDLLADDDARNALRMRTYALGRTMIWPRFVEAGMACLADIRDRKPARVHPAPAPTRDLIPDWADFRAIERMSDSTGMLQHSVYSVPDRAHGYCVDDNARALMLMSQLPHLDDATHDKWWAIYAAFVQAAWNPATASFRNFMAFDRSWLEDQGSDDSCGRTLWALGVTARDCRNEEGRRWASTLFDQVAPHCLAFESPRARGFMMLAAAAMLEAHPGHGLSRKMLGDFGQELMALVDMARRPDWAWFEIVLAYDNCRLPEALLRAGKALDCKDFIERGIETLDWIVRQQTSAEGNFRPVGSESFGRVYSAPLQFDQQPLEAQATIDACAVAFQITGDRRWRKEAMRAYRWFLGDNDLMVPLADATSGECFDGLTPTGPNRNRGAESVLAFHFATSGINRLLKESSGGQYLSVAAE